MSCWKFLHQFFCSQIFGKLMSLQISPLKGSEQKPMKQPLLKFIFLSSKQAKKKKKKNWGKLQLSTFLKHVFEHSKNLPSVAMLKESTFKNNTSNTFSALPTIQSLTKLSFLYSKFYWLWKLQRTFKNFLVISAFPCPARSQYLSGQL